MVGIPTTRYMIATYDYCSITHSYVPVFFCATLLSPFGALLFPLDDAPLSQFSNQKKRLLTQQRREVVEKKMYVGVS